MLRNYIYVVYMYVLKKSTRKDKKYMVITPTGNTIHFGQAGASDYRYHKDKARKDRYLDRHRRREDWTRTGVNTPGFWARWILWNKQTTQASIQDVQRRYGIKIIYS